MDWILKHKLVAIVIVVFFAGVAWYMLAGTSGENPVLTSESPASAPPGAQDLVDSLIALRTVSLDGTIFANPAFQVLHDLTTPILPEPVGRPNPFASLGADVAASASSTRSAQIFTPR